MVLRGLHATGALLLGVAATHPTSERPRIRTLENTRGMSGLTKAPDGTFWAIGERSHTLVQLNPRGDIQARFLIEGVTDGVDTESLAWLAPGTFVVGTEVHERRDADSVLVVRLRGTQARVEKTWRVDYGMWRLRVDANRGLEGLCVAGDHVLAAVEHVADAGHHRFAPLAVLHRPSNRWRAAWVRLTSGRGKLAALSCQVHGSQVGVWAIERHYEVRRIVYFRAPLEGGVIEARTVLDLNQRGLPDANLEGLVRTTTGDFVLLSDNDSGGVDGPTRVFFVSGKPGPGPSSVATP